MCAVECPSHVNIPKLVLEAKSRFRQHHRPTAVDFVLSRAETVTRLGSFAAPLANRWSPPVWAELSLRCSWASTGDGPWLPSRVARFKTH